MQTHAHADVQAHTHTHTHAHVHKLPHPHPTTLFFLSLTHAIESAYVLGTNGFRLFVRRIKCHQSHRQWHGVTQKGE